MDSLYTGYERIFVSVILPLKLEWEPCYGVKVSADGKDGLPVKVEEGDRVRVMFAGKEYTGVVSETGIVPEIEEAKIKDALAVESGLGRIGKKEIGLWRKVAEYYMCSVGEVYKAAYPSQKVSSEQAMARRSERLEKRRKAVMDAAVRKLLMVKTRQEKAVRTLEAANASLLSRIERKSLMLSKARQDGARKKYISEIEKIKADIASNSSAIASAEKEIGRIGEEIAGLQEKGIARTAVQGEGNGIQACEEKRKGLGFSLTEDQDRAFAAIKDAFRLHGTVLLKGVTGSGKTEIYMSIAAEVMAGGKNVLYLVPEIALSKQLEERLESVFGDSLLTFHSGETQMKRAEVACTVQDTVRRQATGEASSYMVIGTRSALFLPHENLGLIIIDEEHDSSYKQESPAPRYNGRDTGIMLGSLHSCPVLLGSATPSLESIYNCMTGKYALVELTRKYHGAADADVEIIDTSAERKKRGMRGDLSLKLIFRIQETLARSEQVVILRSRRSYSPVLQCSVCGDIPRCPHCNVSLSYHKSSGKEICHYCGYSRPHTGKCSKCGGSLTGLGAGTQKIEEEVAALFPQARIARLDGDTAQNRKYESEVIKSFSRGETDILIGTQIVTKGFDFSRLALVAVIGADSLLGQQDFRADEKALQILEQFRGRCGRRGSNGRFVIQTSQPGHPVYRQLYSSGEICTDELLRERRDFGYPPYCRIIDISVKDPHEARAEEISQKLCRELGRYSFRTVGPYSPISGLDAGRHVRTVRISLPKDRMLSQNKALIQKTVSGFERKEGCQGRIVIDVDPA